MAYSPGCFDPIIVGEVDIKIATPSDGGTLTQLGTAYDMIQVQKQAFWHDVHSDRNGGPQGPPVEVQFLGEIAMVRFQLSNVNPTGYALLKKWGSATATAGTVLQSEVGALQLKTKGVRLLLETAAAGDIRNFVCCLPRQPIELGIGTKYSQVSFGFTAYRAPCGHSKANIIYDQDAAQPV